jgi:FeS assembly protein IscX
MSTLTWDSSYAIARALMDAHPDVSMEEVSLGMVYDWTLELGQFEDDPSLASDEILMAIYQDWFEEILHGQN